MITVTVSHNDTACTVEAEGLNYSPDVLDDLTSQAAATVLATVKAAT